MEMDHHHEGQQQQQQEESLAPSPSPASYTVDEALTAAGFGKFQCLVLAYAGLGSFAEAMEIMILSFVGPAVKSQWGLSSTQESFLTTVVFSGMLIGAYSWGLLSDNCGRRKGFLCINMVTSGAGLLSTFSPDYPTLLILRCLVGIGLGGGPVFSSWFLEFVPASNRGFWMVVFSTFWTLGTIFEASLAWIIMPRFGWRWLLAVSCLPSIALLLLYRHAPESPRYLCIKGKLTDAHIILEKMAFVNQAKLPAGMLVSDAAGGLYLDLDQESAPSKHLPLLSSARKRSLGFKSGFSSFLMLFSSELTQTTILLWTLYFGNSFSYYGIILLTSELSGGQSHCHPTFFLPKHLQDDTLFLDVFITSLAELPGILLSALIVDRFGRKVSMAFMFILACIFLLPLVFHQPGIMTAALLFGARMCIIGTFTVACIYAPELYPTSVRASGAGFASSVGRIGGMICPLVAVGLVTGCRLTAAISMLEVVMALSALSVLLFPLETMGRELSDSLAKSHTDYARTHSTLV